MRLTGSQDIRDTWRVPGTHGRRRVLGQDADKVGSLAYVALLSGQELVAAGLREMHDPASLRSDVSSPLSIYATLGGRRRLCRMR